MYKAYCPPEFECQLNVRTLVRHLDLQTVPTTMDPQTVTEFYHRRKISNLDFNNFLQLFFWYERFERFSTNRRLSPEQFQKLVRNR